MRVAWSKIKLGVLAAIFVAVLFAIYFSFSLAPKSCLEVSFLDVGQGDAILFQTPRGGKILIDGGRDDMVLERLGEELPMYSKNIELVIATHDDSDHITGLIDVLKKYNVSVLLYSLPNSESPISKKLIETARARNVKIVQVVKPMMVSTDDGLIIKLLFPVQNMDGAESNDASIAAQFIFGKEKFMLTGDLPISGEEFLVHSYGESLKSDVLKFGHHGSDTSSAPDFLQAVHPYFGIVSAGKNNTFGHPHKSVLDMAEKFGIQILRTDEEGTIHLYTDGVSVWRE